jgi:hypothetical protein
LAPDVLEALAHFPTVREIASPLEQDLVEAGV